MKAFDSKKQDALLLQLNISLEGSQHMILTGARRKKYKFQIAPWAEWFGKSDVVAESSFMNP